MIVPPALPTVADIEAVVEVPDHPDGNDHTKDVAVLLVAVSV
jgi:hypothetical protein